MRYFVFLLPKLIENIILSSTNIEPDYNLEGIYVFQAFKDLCRLHNGRLYTYWNKKYSKNIRFFFFFNSFHNNLSKLFVFHCLQKWRRQILSNSIININCQISRYFFVFFVAQCLFTLFARQERRMRRMGMIKKKILL